MFRKLMLTLRARLESLDYARHRVPGRHDGLRAYHAVRLTRGLAPWRTAWWHQTRLESYRSVRHYALLLDWALSQPPRDRKDGERIPVGGRVLVLRMGHLGDVLHMLPTVREIKRQRPDVQVDLITGPWNRALLEDDHLFDSVYYYTPDIVQYHRGATSMAMKPGEEKAFIRQMGALPVDVLFCPSPPHFAEMPLITGTQPRAYVGAEWPWPDVPASFPLYTQPFNSRHYEMDAVADFLPTLGLTRVDVKLQLEVPMAAHERVAARLPRARAGRITIFPGSGWPGKCWTEEGFAAVADALLADQEVDVVFAGTPAERPLCDRIRARMTHRALNWAGQLSLLESAALIAQSTLVLGNDSAPVHIAAALNIPTVSLWGPTFPEKWAPREGPHVQVRTRQPCAGCLYWHPAASCQGRPPCMAGIPVDEVVEAAEQVTFGGRR